MLRLTVSRPVCLGVKHPCVPRPDFYYCQTVEGFLMCGALSDEMSGLSFTTAADPRQRSHSRVRVLWNSLPYFMSQIRNSPNLDDHVSVFISPRNKAAQLYLQALSSVFVASCDSQSYGGGIRTRLHAGQVTNSTFVLLITSRLGPRIKHRFPLSSYPIVAVQLLRSWKHACLQSRYLATTVVYLLISRSLPSNESTCHNILVRKSVEIRVLENFDMGGRIIKKY
jgi:hypothetical protein